MRLIDADALAKFIDYGHLNNPNDKCYSENDIREMIDMMPTQPVDAVPVIRCKDCKWYYRGGATCMYWDGENNMHGDDYCSRAEREEE